MRETLDPTKEGYTPNKTVQRVIELCWRGFSSIYGIKVFPTARIGRAEVTLERIGLVTLFRFAVWGLWVFPKPLYCCDHLGVVCDYQDVWCCE